MHDLSQGSTRVHYWLRILKATGKAEVERLIGEANELIAILTTIVRKAST